MESNAVKKERASRRDLASTHAWLLAIQRCAMDHGHSVSEGRHVAAPGAWEAFAGIVAMIVGQVRAGYRPYNGKWDFAGWEGDEPYPLIAACFSREYRWVSPSTGREVIRDLGAISHKKILLAASECAEPFSRAEYGKGPLSSMMRFKHPSFLKFDDALFTYNSVSGYPKNFTSVP